MQSDSPQQREERERLKSNTFLVLDKELRLELSGNSAIYPNEPNIDLVVTKESSVAQCVTPYPECYVGILKSRHDDRGSLVELFRNDEWPFSRTDQVLDMGYISATKSLVRRGPHEHKAQTDRFFFLSGAFTLELWDNRNLYTVYDPVRTYQKFGGLGSSVICFAIIPPGVVHSYTNLSSVEGSVINLPNKLYKGYGRHEAVDEIRHEIDPETIFVSRIITGLAV